MYLLSYDIKDSDFIRVIDAYFVVCLILATEKNSFFIFLLDECSDDDYVPSDDNVQDESIPKNFLKELNVFRAEKGLRADSGTDDERDDDDVGCDEGYQDDCLIDRYEKSNGTDDYHTETSSSCVVMQEADSTTQDRVMTVNVKADKKWNKLRWCKFCLKLVQKLPRHFEKVHPKEPEVLRFVKMKDNIKGMKIQLAKLGYNERKLRSRKNDIVEEMSDAIKKKVLEINEAIKEKDATLSRLRSDGGFIHNRHVILSGKGELYTKRRAPPAPPKEQKDVSSYLPCPRCKEMFLKNSLFRHRAKCYPGAYEKGSGVQGEAFLLLPSSVCYTKHFQEDILSSMLNDERGRVAKSDELILKRGQRMFERKGSGRDHRHDISEKMRELARFLIAMRQITGNDTKSLRSCLRPRQVKNVIAAVRKVSNYDEKPQKYGTPSLALKIGHNINDCLVILKGEAAEKMDIEGTQSLDFFKTALEVRWLAEISSGAFRTLRRAKWNRVSTLPTAEDIRKFNKFIQDGIDRYIRMFQEIADPDYLIKLSRLLSCLMVAFNRRRSGEVSRMLLEDVQQARVGDVQPEILEHLSPLERKLAEVLTRFEIRGKRDRGVPVLLTPLMKKATELLKNEVNRRQMNILERNKYFFALPGTEDSYIHASPLFRTFAVECEAAKPEYLRSTNLRKHFASLCTLQNLTEDELDVVVNFMGHRKDIHRMFYRLPDSTLQLVKMGKLISAKELCIDIESADDVQIEDYVDVLEGETDDDSAYDSDEDQLSLTVNNKNNDEDYCPTTSKKTKKRPITDDDTNNKDRHVAKRKRHFVQKKPCLQEETTVAKGKKRFVQKEPCLQEETTVPERKRRFIQKKPWTHDETTIINRHFGTCISASLLPGKDRIEELQNAAPILKNRTWRVIKDKIRNMFPKENS